MAGQSFSNAYNLTVEHDDVRYHMHRPGDGDSITGKNINQSKMDCSGWVAYLQEKTMKDVNEYLGQDVFTREDINRLKTGAAYMVDAVERQSGIVMREGNIDKSRLKEGMIIGEDNGSKGWDQGRPHGIDHITMVVRDPETGKLAISQSQPARDNGVQLTDLDHYFEYKAGRGTKLFVVDPLTKARDLIEAKELQQSTPYQRSANDVQPATQFAANELPARYVALHGEVNEHINRLYNERGIDWGNGGNNTVAACTVACVRQNITDVQHLTVANGSINMGQKNDFEWKTASVDAVQAARTSQQESFAQLAALDLQQSQKQDNPVQTQTKTQSGPSIG